MRLLFFPSLTNPTKPLRAVWWGLVIFLVLMSPVLRAADPPPAVRFVFGGPGGRSGLNFPLNCQTFAFETSNPTIIARLRPSGIFGGIFGGYYGPAVIARIAPRPDGINRNYYAPGAPLWNWSITEILDTIIAFEPAGTEQDASYPSPSDVAADPEEWIRVNGDTIIFYRYATLGEAPPPSPVGPTANFSARGLVGEGSSTFIAGFVQKDVGLRTYVIRVLGPGLRAAGVENPASSPRPRFYRLRETGPAEPVASSRFGRSWQGDLRSPELASRFPQLVQVAEGDYVCLITFPPGSYTVVVDKDQGSAGVCLVEIYDVGAP